MNDEVVGGQAGNCDVFQQQGIRAIQMNKRVTACLFYNVSILQGSQLSFGKIA